MLTKLYYAMSLILGMGFIVIVGYMAANGYFVEPKTIEGATCIETVLEGEDLIGSKSVYRCEMPDGAICYLYGRSGSISCLNPSP